MKNRRCFYKITISFLSFILSFTTGGAIAGAASNLNQPWTTKELDQVADIGIKAANLPTDNPDFDVTSLISLANALAKSGDKLAADKVIKEATAKLVIVVPGESFNYVNFENAIEALAFIGEGEEAQALINSKIGDRDRVFELANLGVGYAEAGDFAKAIEIANQLSAKDQSVQIPDEYASAVIQIGSELITLKATNSVLSLADKASNPIVGEDLRSQMAIMLCNSGANNKDELAKGQKIADVDSNLASSSDDHLFAESAIAICRGPSAVIKFAREKFSPQDASDDLTRLVDFLVQNDHDVAASDALKAALDPSGENSGDYRHLIANLKNEPLDMQWQDYQGLMIQELNTHDSQAIAFTLPYFLHDIQIYGDTDQEVQLSVISLTTWFADAGMMANATVLYDELKHEISEDLAGHRPNLLVEYAPVQAVMGNVEDAISTADKAGQTSAELHNSEVAAITTMSFDSDITDPTSSQFAARLAQIQAQLPPISNEGKLLALRNIVQELARKGDIREALAVEILLENYQKGKDLDCRNSALSAVALAEINAGYPDNALDLIKKIGFTSDGFGTDGLQDGYPVDRWNVIIALAAVSAEQ